MEPLHLLFTAIGFAVIVWLVAKANQNLLDIVYLLFFFLPFEWTPTIELSGFTFKINHLVGGVLIVFWILHLIKLKKISKNPYISYYIFLIGAIILSISKAVFIGKAIVNFSLITFTLLLAIIIYDLVKTDKELEKINRYVMISAWIVVIFSIWQFLGDFVGLPNYLTGLREGYNKATFGFPRVHAFSREPLYLGSYLFIPFGLTVGKILKEKSKLSIWLLLFSIILVMFLTLSRGAILGLILAIIVLIYIFPKKIINLRNIVYALTVIILSAGLIFTGLNLYGSDKAERFVNHLTIKDINIGESTVSRLINFNTAIEISKTSPLIGIGIGNYGSYTANYTSTDPRVNDIVNNEYLELLVETGYLGLFIFIALILFTIARSIIIIRKSEDKDIYVLGALTAAFIGMMVQYNFFSTLSIIHIWAMFALLSIYQGKLDKQ